MSALQEGPAYLVGVRNFSTPALRVLSARIMGIESDHRTLARIVGAEVKPRYGGPIEKITGVLEKAESIDPPNNNGYERTLKWTKISQAGDALTPFADKPPPRGTPCAHRRRLDITTTSSCPYPRAV